MKTYLPDKRALLTLRILIILISLILIGIVRIYIPLDIVVIIFSIAIITAAIFFMFIYLPLYFGSLRYEATDTELTRHSGVFMKSHQTVQFSAVQYYTVVTTPMSHKTGLNFIVLFVYGGQFQLMYLSSSDIREILQNTGRGGKR